MRQRLRDEAEADDPLLSVINLIDVFLVLIAALPWMLSLLMTFTHNLFVNIPAYVR